MAAAPMQAAIQHIRSSLGFYILPKDTSACRPGVSNHDLQIRRHQFYSEATAIDHELQICDIKAAWLVRFINISISDRPDLFTRTNWEQPESRKYNFL